jgi:uncharacterized protein (DUF302 family)
MSYGYFKNISADFKTVDEKIRQTLAENGFGVITEIDVKSTFKTKLDVDFRPYTIIGACNPAIAHKALSEEPDVGLLLPCNVVVIDNLDGTIKVGAIDAKKMLSLSGRDDLHVLADKVNSLLKNAIDSV